MLSPRHGRRTADHLRKSQPRAARHKTRPRATFGLNPHVAPLLPIWQAGRLAVAANVGPLIVPTTKQQIRDRSVPLPANLMSHNDQTSTWQAGATEGARRGWGGLMADQYLSTNGLNSVFTAISTSGNAVLLAGQSVIQYQMSTSQQNPAIRINSATSDDTTVFGAQGAGARVREIIRDTAGSSYFMQDHSTKVIRSQDAADLLNAQFAAGSPGDTVPPPSQVLNPITRAMENNGLALQLQTVAKVIAANQLLGLRRQVFFVSIGGFDNHDIQNTSQSPLMARLAHGMALFRQRARQPRRYRHASAGDHVHRLGLLAHLHHQQRRAPIMPGARTSSSWAETFLAAAYTANTRRWGSTFRTASRIRT